MSVPLPLCIIGAGSIGRRHIEVASASPTVRITAIVDPDPVTRAALTAEGLPAVAMIEDAPAETRACVIAEAPAGTKSCLCWNLVTFYSTTNEPENGPLPRLVTTPDPFTSNSTP